MIEEEKGTKCSLRTLMVQSLMLFSILYSSILFRLKFIFFVQCYTIDRACSHMLNLLKALCNIGVDGIQNETDKNFDKKRKSKWEKSKSIFRIFFKVKMAKRIGKHYISCRNSMQIDSDSNLIINGWESVFDKHISSNLLCVCLCICA